MGNTSTASKKARLTRTPNVLQEAMKHVRYEIDMLGATASYLAKGLSDDTIKNACLESFAIHTRALIDFFFPGSTDPRLDDILSVDFFNPPARWTSGYPTYPYPPADLADIRPKVHKRVAHLTYERILLQVDWPFVQIKDQIETVFADFQSRLREEPELSRILSSVPHYSELTPTTTVASTTPISTVGMSKPKGKVQEI